MLIEDILGPVEGMKVLILDDFTTRMIANIMRMSELSTLYNIASVQYVTSVPTGRRGDFSAVYFMMPTEPNIKKYIDDFSLNPCPYSKGYIFLTNTCPDSLFTMLKKARSPVKKLKGFEELYCEYICYSENAFSLEDPSHFNLHFNPKKVHERGYLNMKIAAKLVTICVQMKHYPSQIRYFGTGCGTANNEIATHFKRSLSHFKLENSNFHWKSVNSTLLIVDRGFDTITPVIHDLTTEALARDFLGIDVEGNADQKDRRESYCPNQYVYTVKTGADSEKIERRAFLDDSNFLWSKIRFMNIKEAVNFMRSEIDALQNQEQLEHGKVKDLDLTKLNQMMKMYPEQQKKKAQIGALSYVLDATLQSFAREQIECEQTLATNCSKKPKEGRNWKLVSELLKKDAKGELNNALTIHEKIRLLILYARSKATVNGLSLRELKSRMLECDVTVEYLTIITNLCYMGVPILNQDSQWENYEDQARDWRLWPVADKDTGGKTVRPDQMPEFIKWCPTIYHLVKTMIESPKDMLDRYPLIEIRNRPVVKRKRRKKSRSKRSLRSQRTVTTAESSYKYVYDCNDYEFLEREFKSSFIVFVAGGLTYGEIKLAKILTDLYKGNQEVAVIFGSTQILNPDDFIEKLHNLNPDEPKYKGEDKQFVVAESNYYDRK
ncbi:syntaxin-binding protein 1-like [Symsagittifera roscoffensis]|uniref:syntaxin-binding protein 1-like n=1 Tax=Symsagittifera roscoffensis TaxID=84072 RepID=UPI00307B747D